MNLFNIRDEQMKLLVLNLCFLYSFQIMFQVFNT